MPKPKKRSAADAAASSEARSKRLYSSYLDEDLRAELRSWPKRDRARVGRLIQRVQENFGNPHLHSGTGIRDLSPKGSRLNVLRMPNRERTAIDVYVGITGVALLSHHRQPR